jgi:hypothetical protein
MPALSVLSSRMSDSIRARARGRGPALTVDRGWREVADTALTFIQRFV